MPLCRSGAFFCRSHRRRRVARRCLDRSGSRQCLSELAEMTCDVVITLRGCAVREVDIILRMDFSSEGRDWTC